MSSKRVIASMLLGMATPLVFAVSANAKQGMDTELAELRAQVAALRAELEALAGEPFNPLVEIQNPYSPLDFGPYFGYQVDPNVRTLFLNDPEVNKGVSYLLRSKYVAENPQSMAPMGRLNLGLFAQVYSYWHSKDNFVGRINNQTNIAPSQSDINGYIQLNVVGQLNDWIQGYMKFLGQSGGNDASLARYTGLLPILSGGQLFWDQLAFTKNNTPEIVLDDAFINIGNLVETPVFAQAGYYYLPTGALSTTFVSFPLTRWIGQIRNTAAAIGFTDWGMAFTAYAYNGNSTPDQPTRQITQLNNWGVDLQYTMEDMFDTGIRFMAGASYSDNAANALALGYLDDYFQQNTLDPIPGIDTGNLGNGLRKTGMADGRIALGWGPAGGDWALSGFFEYITTVDRFGVGDFPTLVDFDTSSLLVNLDCSDVNFLTPVTPVGPITPALVRSGKGCSPHAWNAEIALDTSWIDQLSRVAITWQQSYDSQAYLIPKRQYGVAFQSTPWERFAFTFEWMNRKGYEALDGGIDNLLLISASGVF